ncbi:hypothetical protein BIU87_08600 [Streptomyces sp. ZS0098]|nr:hypothetical protein BIU87_08600 [Streptomyces sp. ZS0098]
MAQRRPLSRTRTFHHAAPWAAPTATDQYEEGMRDHVDPETIRSAERKGSPHGGDSSSDALDGRPVVDSP